MWGACFWDRSSSFAVIYRKSALALSIAKIRTGKEEEKGQGGKGGKRQKTVSRRNKIKTKENYSRVREALHVTKIESYMGLYMLESGNKKGIIKVKIKEKKRSAIIVKMCSSLPKHKLDHIDPRNK